MVGTFEKMQKDLSNGTYDFTDNGKCTQCGKCCSNLLPMTEKEIEVIRKYIKRYHIKEYKHLIPLAQPVIDMTVRSLMIASLVRNARFTKPDREFAEILSVVRAKDRL